MLANMDDSQLSALGLKRLGDRIAVRMFCNKHERKGDLVQRLKEKINADRLNLKRNRGGKQLLGNVNARKQMRSVSITWSHLEISGYKQVRMSHGGGVRALSLNVSTTLGSILEEAKKLFFNEGKSAKGLLCDMSVSLCGPAKETLDLSMTLEDYLFATKMTHVRLAMTTRFHTAHTKKQLLLGDKPLASRPVGIDTDSDDDFVSSFGHDEVS